MSGVQVAVVAGRGHETFHHGADIGVRGRGSTLAEALAEVGVALTEVVTDSATVVPREAVSLELSRPSDDELLLLDWVNALIYESTTRGMLFARIEVTLDDDRLRAVLLGEPVDVARHRPAVEVKAATFAELAVVRTSERGWMVQCVVDV